MEMPTIMVIILIAYSSKCYNFVLLHAVKKNERAVVFRRCCCCCYNLASKCEQQSQGQAGLCVWVCICASYFFYLFIFITITIYCNWIIGASCTHWIHSFNCFVFFFSLLTIQRVQFTVHWFQLSFNCPIQVCVCQFECSAVRVQCSLFTRLH